VNGKIYKTCAKAYKNGGGNKEHFKQHWKNGGWKTTRAALNSKLAHWLCLLLKQQC
jgi:hypothetical protein